MLKLIRWLSNLNTVINHNYKIVSETVDKRLSKNKNMQILMVCFFLIFIGYNVYPSYYGLICLRVSEKVCIRLFDV
jgi:hypothetical protein